MNSEYCNYLMSQNEENQMTFYQINGEEISKTEFFHWVDKALDQRKKKIRKDDFNPDYYLFEIIDYFFSKDKIFLHHEGSDQITDCLDRCLKQVDAIERRWVDNNQSVYQGMYDDLFDVIYRYMILMENARISIDINKDKLVEYHTSDIKIYELCTLLWRQIDNTKLSAVRRFNVFLRLTKNPKPIIPKIAFQYLLFVMHATYTRNYEIREAYGYGWNG